MGWVTPLCGSAAIIEPGQNVKDHLRVAIQSLSTNAPVERHFTCTGWVEAPLTGKACFAHADGAVGPDGHLSTVKTELSGAMSLYKFPSPAQGETLKACYKAALRLLDVAPPRIMIPLLATVFRSVLGPADFALFLVGRTGTGKSELSALASQFFGAGLDSRHLPGSFTSTGNALEVQAFVAKNALFCIDDFVASTSRIDTQRSQQTLACSWFGSRIGS